MKSAFFLYGRFVFDFFLLCCVSALVKFETMNDEIFGFAVSVLES